MFDQGANWVASVLSDQPGRTGVRVGVVATTAPFTVNLQGRNLAHLGRPSWYTPAIGDVVTLEHQGQSWMCTGKLVAT